MEDMISFFHRISFLSVEPKIGVGYFGGNKTSTLSTAVVDKLRYNLFYN